MRTVFLSSKSQGGIMTSSLVSFCSLMTDSTNRLGKPASAYFLRIRISSASRLLLISFALWRSVRIAFFLYLFGILEVQNTGNLLGLVYTDVVISLSSFSIAVSRKCDGLFSSVNFILGWYSFSFLNRSSAQFFFRRTYMSSTYLW